MYFWSETPYKEMWNQIRYLKSPKNVENLLNGKITSNRKVIHDDQNLQKKSHEIASCIRQADEYYKAAETVSIVTEPLLQFYGAQSLSKAVILANNPDISLADLKYHGLSTRASTASEMEIRDVIQDYSNDSNMWEIEKEYAITNDGVFPNLCLSIGQTPPNKGTVFSFKELIRLLPDLSEKYNRHYNESSDCFFLLSSFGLQTNSDGKYEIYFSDKVDINHVKNAFPEFNDSKIYEDILLNSKYNGYCSLVPMLNLPFGAIEKGTIAGKYFVKPLDCGLYKSFAVIFGALFILSNLVRYKPGFWMREIEGELSGSISIVEEFCNLSKRRLPNDALESIWNEEFLYGTPGYSI